MHKKTGTHVPYMKFCTCNLLARMSINLLCMKWTHHKLEANIDCKDWNIQSKMYKVSNKWINSLLSQAREKTSKGKFFIV